MKYKIGQVLYVLLNREMSICPVQVVEEITKRSINGENVSYIVKIGKNKETIPLSEIGGQPFESIEDLRNTLIDRITKTIDVIVSTTLEKANSLYKNIETAPSKESNVNQEIAKDNDEDAILTLPDGTTAKVKMPI